MRDRAAVRHHHLACALGRRAVTRRDVDLAVFLDVDLDAGLLLNGAHVLAAGADQRADLFGVDLHHGDARRMRLHHRRLGDRLHHAFEDRQSSFVRLCQRLFQHLRRQPGDLDVHLQGGDAARRASHLEVHVTDVIFETLNI